MHSMVPEPVARAAHEAHALLRTLGIPHLFIGGLAVGIYGWERMTTDVDVLVNAEDIDQVPGRTITASGVHAARSAPGKSFEVDEVPVDVIAPPAKGKVFRELLNHPQWVGGLPFASLPSLVLLKLISGRAKDLADLVEIFKRQEPAVLRDTGRQLKGLTRDEELLADFEVVKLTIAAESEGRRNPSIRGLPLRANRGSRV